MRRRVLLAAIVLLAALPTSARAGRIDFDQWQAGLRAAALQWGGMPPCGTPRFEHWSSVGPRDGDMWVRGWLDRPASMECVIHVSSSVDARAGDAGWGPMLTCPEVVHEVGHLWGRDHSDDPADVMFGRAEPVEARWQAAWACRRVMREVRYAWACSRLPGSSVPGCRPVMKWVLR